MGILSRGLSVQRHLDFDEAVLGLDVESSSEDEFASRYKRYLENII